MSIRASGSLDMCVFENESIKPPGECDHAEELCSMQSIIKFKLSLQQRAVDSIITLCVQTTSIQALTSGHVRHSRLCLVSEDIDSRVRSAESANERMLCISACLWNAAKRMLCMSARLRNAANDPCCQHQVLIIDSNPTVGSARGVSTSAS